MSGVAKDTVLVQQQQVTVNGIIPIPYGDHKFLIGERQFYDEQDQDTLMHATKAYDIAALSKPFKEFQVSVEKNLFELKKKIK